MGRYQDQANYQNEMLRSARASDPYDYGLHNVEDSARSSQAWYADQAEAKHDSNVANAELAAGLLAMGEGFRIHNARKAASQGGEYYEDERPSGGSGGSFLVHLIVLLAGIAAGIVLLVVYGVKRAIDHLNAGL